MLPTNLPYSQDLLEVVLSTCQNGIMLLRPVYDAAGTTIVDLAWVHLNPAARQMLQLPQCPPESFLTLFPTAEAAGVFGFYRDAFLSGQVERRQNNYQHDGLDGYYLLVAQRLNLPVFGVNLPNLFVLTFRPELPGAEPFYINCYNRGLVLSRTDIEHYVAQLNITPNPIFFEPCSHLDIVRRAMRNLQMSFERLQEPVKATEVALLLSILE